MRWFMVASAAVLAGAVLQNVLLPGLSEARAAGLEGASVVALVNRQRAANGIPPITTVDQEYASSWCPREFEAPFTHGETGRVSAPDNAWSATSTPYSTAPLHQYVIYDPLATIAGDVHMADGTDCMAVGQADFLAPITAPAPIFYAFVSERGPRFARASEVARELPTTPQQQLGYPASERTGPQILLFAIGLGFTPHAAKVSLTTSAGVAVPNTKVAAEGHGGVLVPPPLKAGTSYLLTVGWTGEPRQSIEGFEVVTEPPESAIQTLRFATAPAPKPVHHHRRRRRS
jgi:hypothetical protein